MNSTGIFGWVAALVLAVAAAGIYIYGNAQIKLVQEVADAKEGVARRHAEEIRGTMDELHAELEAAQAALAAAESQLAAQAAAASASGGGSTVPENFDPAGLLESMLDKGGDQNASPFAGMMDMFKGEQGEKYAEMGAGYAINMQYADLFRELGLDPETEATLRDIIKQSMVEQMQQGFAMMENMEDADMKGMAQETLDGQARMRDAVATVLTPEELAQFDVYQEEMPRRMMKQSYDMQLGMMASGLDNDTRSLVSDVLADEMVALQQPENIPEKVGDFAEVQRAAFDRALERLSPDLDDAQLEQVERFVDQQLDFMELGAGMFGGMGDDAETPAGAE